MCRISDLLNTFLSYLTEAMWIGSSRNNIETPLALKWRKTVKALGVHFSYNNEESVQKNFYDKLKGIKSQIRLWS